MSLLAKHRNLIVYNTSWFLFALVILSLFILSVGLYHALFASPPDYQQGDSVRIMYIHVPAAYIAMAAYAIIVIFSAIFLIWKLAIAQLLAEIIAPTGAIFTLICLLTGSLWGKPIWGTWWVWDARLTSVLVLFFLYISYIALLNAFSQPHQGKKSASVVALMGAINLPIIKFSVNWWNTLHQPSSIFREEGIAIAPQMLTPLLWMIIAFFMLFLSICALKIDTKLRRNIKNS